MQFIDFRQKLKDFIVFDLRDIRKIEADFDLRRLNEWAGKGYIKNIRRGYYIFSDLQIDEQVLFIIANKIYSPSYISFEMALSMHNLIPEAVYGITCATSQKTNNFQTAIGNFIYKHIKPKFMFGYELREYGNHHWAVAEIEKAMLDYLYFNTKIKDAKDFEGIRFNGDEFKNRVDAEKFNKYLEAFESRSLALRVKNFLIYINNA